MLKNINFQRKVFILNTALVLGIMILAGAGFFIYIYNVLKTDSENYFQQVVEKVSTNLDNVIMTMDVVSTQLVASNDLQEIFSEANQSVVWNDNYFDLNLSQKKKGVDILVSINSPKDRVKRLSVFNKPNTFLSLGIDLEDSQKVNQNVPLESWYKCCTDSKASFEILPPHKDAWVPERRASTVISLIRPFISTYSSYETLGIIEIQQDYSKLVDICQLDNTANHLKLLVIDQNKNIIFPYEKSRDGETSTYLESLKRGRPGMIYSFYNKISGQNEYACYTTMKNYNWTVILSQPQRDFMKPAYKILNLMLIICFIFILAAVLALFLVSRSLTKPIRELRESIKSITFENPSISLSTSHNEIELLKNTFNDMLRELKDSTNKIIQARASEIQAHFLALQAQINPHFLYNSIMSISAAGQEAGSEKVQIMCAQLGDIFRYIASTGNSDTTIQDELNHAEIYLKFIKWRYEDLLDFSIHIQDEMRTLKVAKLILQPIIENCFSHGFYKIKPPFKIFIHGTCTGSVWTIEICDNGRGFSESTLEKLRKQKNRIDENIKAGKITNELEVGGMALINIYTRLKLLYNESTVFSIENCEDGGGKVTIGGLIQRINL